MDGMVWSDLVVEPFGGMVPPCIREEISIVLDFLARSFEQYRIVQKM